MEKDGISFRTSDNLPKGVDRTEAEKVVIAAAERANRRDTSQASIITPDMRRELDRCFGKE